MAHTNSLPNQTLIVDWVFAGLGFLGLVLIIAARCITPTRLKLDDYITVVVWMLGLGLIGQTTWAIQHEGQAEHQQNVSHSKLEKAAMSLMVHEALWTGVNTGLRISAWLFLRPIFITSKYRVIPTVSIVLCLCHGVASMLVLFLICRPIAANWDPEVDGTCGNVLVSYVFMESAGLVLDMAVLMLPPMVISRLTLSARRKWSIMIIFEIGWLIVIVTGLRLQALRLSVSPDYIWSESYLGMLSAVGSMLGIFLCSVPSMPLIFRSLRSARPSSTLSKAVSNAPCLNSTKEQWATPAIVKSQRTDILPGTGDGIVVVVREVSECSVLEEDDVAYDIEAMEPRSFL